MMDISLTFGRGGHSISPSISPFPVLVAIVDDRSMAGNPMANAFAVKVPESGITPHDWFSLERLMEQIAIGSHVCSGLA